MRPARLAMLLAGGLALAPGMGLAADPATGGDTPLARLVAAYTPVRTLTAAFTQETHFAGFPTPRTYGGRLDLSRPDHIRWDYTEGSGQQVYVAGRTLTVYAPEHAQAIVSELNSASDSNVPVQLLADVTRLGDTYRAATGSEPGSIVLTPLKRVPGAPERVTLWLDPDTSLIDRVLLAVPGGSTSDIRFSDVHVNVPIDPARFAFHPPKGTHVIRAAELMPHPPGGTSP
jgi:outer membrane lipoprotein-sorting protein